MSTAAETGVKARGQRKSATAYRTISEVSEDLAVPQHVLRFWETKFSQVRPLKRGGGRRYYRPEDVALLRKIQKLLYDDGFTIKGVQKLLREGRAGPDDSGEAAEQGQGGAIPLKPADEAVGQPAKARGLPSDLRAELSDLLVELRALQATLKTFRT